MRIALCLIGLTAGLASGPQAMAQSSNIAAPEAVPASTPSTGVFETRRSVAVTSGRSAAAAPADRTLVVPGRESTSEQLAALATDMSIMCRILDTKVTLPYMPVAEQNLFRLSLLGRRSSRSVLASDSGLARGIYIADYGAIFLMTVDFPLTAPEEAQEQEKPEGDTDPVWAQARGEVYGTEPFANGTPDRAVPAYDAEKAEQFSATLLDTLRHAANIKTLKQSEWVTVLVKSPAPNAQGRRRGRPILGDLLPGVATNRPIASSPFSQTVLSLRAHKADIDAFSAKQLDSEQFRTRAELVIY